MKADPEAQQHIQGVYNLKDADGSNLMPLHIDYENMEESFRNMLNHNGQPSFNEKEDTSRQMHAYTSQLEDIRSTCAMLSERIKRMEDQNNLLLANAEKRRFDYEGYLERVASQVFRTFSYQLHLQLECDALRMQVRHLTGNLPHSLPGSSRSSESSANGQSTRGSASDDVFTSQQSPYSPNFTTNIPGVVNHIPGVGQKIHDSALFERRGQTYINGHPHDQHFSREAVQFNGDSLEHQCERQAWGPHRIQTGKTPPLHAIPENIELISASVQNLAEFHPRFPRSGSEIIAGSSSLVSTSGPQRAAFDDEAVGRMSISRERQRSAERSKVTRSRSFDGHSSYGRTQPATPIPSMSPKRAETSALSSYRPGPPLYSIPVEYQAQRYIQNLTKESLTSEKTTSGPNALPVKHEDSLSFDQEQLQGDCRPPSTTVAKTSPGIFKNHPLLPTSHTVSVPLLVTQYPRPAESQELKGPTVREMHTSPFIRECLQKSFRATMSCERREQRKVNDDVPSTGRSAKPMALHDPNLPPPPPPPPKDEIPEDISEETKSEGIPTVREPTCRTNQKTRSENLDLSERESYAAAVACRISQSLEHLNDSWKNVAVGQNSPQTSPLQSNYTIFPRSNTDKDDEMNEVSNLSPTADQTTEDQKTKLPLKSPTQFQTPNPPISTSTDNAIPAQAITPAVSHEALSSPNQHTKVEPRRRSEGMVGEFGKKSRLSAPSQKRHGNGRQKAAENPLTETRRQGLLSPKSGISMTSCSSNKNSLINSVSPSPELSDKNRSPELNTGKDYTNDKSTASPSSSDQHQPRSHRAVSYTKVMKSTSDNKSPKQGLSSGGNPKELRAKYGIKNEKKSETKKNSGNQKSFVDMVKSKFGGKGSASKKTSELQESQAYVAANEMQSSSAIDPRTLSLEPNDLPPKKLKKKASNKTERDPVGRKLSRPFLSKPTEEQCSVAQQPAAPKTDFPTRMGFSGRNNSKRSENSQHGAFANGSYVNNMPYGRVELIPIGAPIPGAFQFDNGEKNIATPEIIGHETEKQMNGNVNAPVVNAEMILSPRKKSLEDFSQSKRQMNNYENVVLLNDIQKGSIASNDVTSHGYENVVIVKVSENTSGPETDDSTKKEEADERAPATKIKPKDKGLVLKEISPLQRIWSSLSNQSLNKMSGSEDGIRATLHEIRGSLTITFTT